jgi:hypothetical protein
MACGGGGTVISNLGGSPSKVSCPWCEGSGVRRPGIDAQAAWIAAREQDGPASEGAATPEAP